MGEEERESPKQQQQQRGKKCTLSGEPSRGSGREERRRRLCLTLPWRLASNEAAFPTAPRKEGEKKRIEESDRRRNRKKKRGRVYSCVALPM